MFPVDFLLLGASNVPKRKPGDLQAGFYTSIPNWVASKLKTLQIQGQVGRSSMRRYLKDVEDVTFPRIKNATPKKKCRKLQNEGRLKMHSNCHCNIIIDFIHPYI